MDKNQTALDFNLPDQSGRFHKLSDYRGRWVILYFYPRDDTPGCTKEACGFRDSLEDLKRLGVVVLGVSKDSSTSHFKFSQKHHLNFPVLSDPEKETIMAYGAWGPKKFMGRQFMGTLRKTFVIDPSGRIRQVYEKVDPIHHAAQILQDLNALIK